MKALVIYDLTGRVWQIIYGEEEVGAQLERMDVTDPGNPKPVFHYLPETDIGRLQKQVEELEGELTDTQLALAEQYEENLSLQEEVTNTQLALVELYEGGEV